MFFFNYYNKYNNQNYYCSDKNNEIRKLIRIKLEEFNEIKKNDIIDLNRIDIEKEMNDYICEINVPGYGKVCGRHLFTLRYATLMLAYENIKNVYVLPNTLLQKNYTYSSNSPYPLTP